MRKEIIRTKIKEIEESIELVGENLPDTFEELKKNIRDFYDFIRRVEEILED